MKRCFYLACGFLIGIKKLGGQEIMPVPYSSSVKINYIRSWDALAPISHPDTLLTRPYQDVRQTSQYIDGLGRVLQTVVKKGSLVTGESAKDMVAPIVYNDFGLEAFKYLPFAANTTGSNTSLSDGLFKLNPFQQDSTFCKNQFSDETYFYARTVSERSPLHRSIENYSAGNNWVGTASESSEANRRGIKSKFMINKVADSVRLWRVTNVSNGFGTYSTSGIYPAGELNKNIIADEHNKQVIEFKDKEGKIM